MTAIKMCISQANQDHGAGVELHCVILVVSGS